MPLSIHLICDPIVVLILIGPEFCQSASTLACLGDRQWPPRSALHVPWPPGGVRQIPQIIRWSGGGTCIGRLRVGYRLTTLGINYIARRGGGSKKKSWSPLSNFSVVLSHFSSGKARTRTNSSYWYRYLFIPPFGQPIFHYVCLIYLLVLYF